MKRLFFYVVAITTNTIIPCFGYSQNIIRENFQTWTSQVAYGNYSQAGSGGTWNMVQCKIAPSGVANGTGSAGYIQLDNSPTGILTLPQLISGGATTITFTLRVSTVSGASILVEKQIGAGAWSNVQQVNTGLSTTAQTYIVNVNDNSNNLTLRLTNNGTRTDFVHDVSLQLSGATDISNYTYRTKGSGNWDQTSPAVWERSGDGGNIWGDVTNLAYIPDYNNGSIVIQSGHSLTSTSILYLDQTTIQSGATLTTASSISINVLDGTGTDIDVYGNLILTAASFVYVGAGTPSGYFRSGSYYDAIDQASNIPAPSNTTWDANSTLNIAGNYTSQPGFSNIVSYGNIIWNTTGSTGSINLNTTLVNIAGYFKISSTGTGSLRLNGASPLVLSIGGNFIVEGGKLDFNNGNGTTTLNIAGSMNITGGTFGLSTMNMVTININGTGKTLVCTPAAFAGSAQLTINIANTADYTLSGDCNISSGNINVNGTLTTQTNQVTGAGNATINGKLITENTGGLTGNISCAINGPVLASLGAASTIEYNAIGSQTLTGRTDYNNLTLTNASTKTCNANTTVGHLLQINAGELVFSNYTLQLNGTVAGTGSLSGTASSNLIIGGASPGVGTLIFTPGSQLLNTFTMNRTGVMANAAAVLGSNLTAKSFALTNGILATDNFLLTWDNTGSLNSPNNPWTANQTNFSNSYIATCDVNGNALTLTTPFDGSIGFRVNNVGISTNINFPVGADFVSANRMLISNSGSLDNFTVVVSKGDIGNTPLPGINRIWHVHAALGTGITATMQLFFSKWNWSTTHFGSGQDETEDGFLYEDAHLVQKDYTNQFVNNSQIATSDIVDFSNNATYNYNTEIFGKFSPVSIDLAGNHNGVTSFTRFAVVNANGIILPATLKNFTAHYEANKVMLGWISVNEINIDRYEIERSSNGSVFAQIAQTQAHNSGALSINYNNMDSQPLAGNNYYRIKVIDKSGKFIYSNVVLINFVALHHSISLYPNPVKDYTATISLKSLQAGNYSLALCNNLGQILWQKNIIHNSITANYVILFPAYLRKGLYHLIIRGQNINLQKNLLLE